jgi:hypothetical protein
MKRIAILFLVLLAAFSINAQEHRKDTTAVILLDRMSSIIGSLESCSFTLNISEDVVDVELGLVKNFSTSEVYLDGPDKLLININGQKGHRTFWYNGLQLVYYSFTENNYAIIDAPPTTIEMIATVNESYGIDFPAADFFYPTFTDDLLELSDDLIYAGRATVDGRICYRVIAKNKEMGVQIWISDDEWFLPVKFVMVYYDETPNIQYEATFANWKVNPDLPAAMFEFVPPPKANQLRLVARNQ